MSSTSTAARVPTNSGVVVGTREPEVPEPDDSRDSRKMDPEILVMSRMVRLLDELPEGAQKRVICWLTDRYRAEHP